MEFYTYTLPSGAVLTGYLRDATEPMPEYNVRPAVVILPGGGYEYCSARESDPVAMQFLQAGYHVFILQYTVTSPPLHWQPLLDASGAILHLRQNAAALRVESHKIAVCGFSAGGHLAASTAILWDAEPLRSVLGIHGAEARPDAVGSGLPGDFFRNFCPQGLFRSPGRQRRSPSCRIQPGEPYTGRFASVLSLAHSG